MFISFFHPLPIRKTEAFHLWIYYKQISEFSPNEVAFLASSVYFQDPKYFVNRHRPEMTSTAMEYNGFTLSSVKEIQTYKKYIIDEMVFNTLLDENEGNLNAIWAYLRCNRFAPLEDEIEKCIRKMGAENFLIDGVLSWCNCPSLTHVAQKFSLPVIHNELGAFRPPYYRYMAYFDFRGVTVKTECRLRYDAFQSEIRREKTNCPSVFTKKELLFLLRNFDSTDPSIVSESYPIGLALQVEDDSECADVADYSNVYSNRRLIEETLRNHSWNEILIRKHPGDIGMSPTMECQIDNSANSAQFIQKVHELHTVHSNIALEAILYGKETTVFSDSPFNLVTDLDDDEHLMKMNFFIIGYMIPYHLLFCYEYYKWRLTMPKELEIYYFHLYCMTGDEKYLVYDYDVPLLRAGRMAFYRAEKEKKIHILQKEINEQRKIAQAEAEQAHRIEAARAQLEQQIAMYENSTSWKLTAPLRKLKRLFT